MSIYLVVALSMLNSVAQRGSKVAVSLYALELGAGAASVGVLAALFATFPLLLAVEAGRLSDRFGVRVPIVCGSLTMAAGLTVAFFTTSIPLLFLCPALIGLGHIFFHVSVHNLVGSFGAAAARTRNFSTFALGSSIAAFIGPSLAGFAIELAGFRTAFAILACVAAASGLYVLLHRSLIPQRVRHEEEEQAKSAFDLLAIPALRRTLIMSGVTLTGIELFSFYLPIYGRSIGLSPSVIGMVLSSYAVAGFIVRSFMHRLAQRYTEVGVLTGSLFVAALTYFAVPGLGDGWLLAAAAFSLGLALGSAQPLTIILTYNYAPAGRSGEALGMRIMANKVTQIAVPLAFGGFGAALGAVPVFIATGAFLLVAGLISLKGGSE
ncbi:MAG TPA: MFS transporter [Burkholderiales bacterium]|nr:MFS transporter [Burkholderiales bacterium]